MKKVLLLTIVTVLLFSSGMAARQADAQQGTPPAIAVDVALDNTTYNPGEAITAVISLESRESTDTITNRGFSASPFHLFLEIFDPDNKRIVADEIAAGIGDEPLPPRLTYYDTDNDGDEEPVQVKPVEILPGTANPAGRWTLVVPDIPIRDHYTLTKTGKHAIKVVVPIATYSQVFQTTAGPDGIPGTGDDEHFAELSATASESHLESNPTYFGIYPDGDGDGYHSDVDCDDNNPAVNPGATEIPNDGIDNDCDAATPVHTVSGSGTNTPASAKWPANMTVNVDGSGPSGTVTYYYPRRRESFTSTTITAVTASGGIATITGTGNASRVTGLSVKECTGCPFTVTIWDDAVNGDSMDIVVHDDTAPDGIFFDSPGGYGDIKYLTSGNFTVTGE
jgi:hypothetical protein